MPASSPAARYDGRAAWYDAMFAGNAGGEEAAFVRHHLGDGDGAACLDVACGTGLLGPAVAGGGRFVYVGLHPCFIGPFVDRTGEA